jgi:mannose-6-phosphate isomerase-like protein (cupin superfamily)
MTTDAITPFKFVNPETGKAKTVVWLARTDRLFATMQCITKGGETNLHSHSHLDGFWFVVKGRARFYSDVDTVACELGPMEGALVPRGVKYWFESASDEPLELLQVEASDVALRTHQELMADRTNHAAGTRTGTSVQIGAPS